MWVGSNNDDRRNAAATASEVAAIIPDGVPMEGRDSRDIIIRKIGGGVHRISEWNPAYDSLHFVLMFPHGDPGFKWEIPKTIGRGKVSAMQYGAYRLHERENDFNVFQKSGRLGQVETQRYSKHQTQCCSSFIKTPKHLTPSPPFRSGWLTCSPGQRVSGLHTSNATSRRSGLIYTKVCQIACIHMTPILMPPEQPCEVRRQQHGSQMVLSIA